MRRREFIALAGASVAWPFAAMAQHYSMSESAQAQQTGGKRLTSVGKKTQVSGL
jgi:hypothetical protein